MSQRRRLAVVLVLNVVLVAGLAFAGALVGSLALLSAAGDSLADSVALGLGLLAVWLRDRHGRPGAINLVALVNVLVLLAVTIGVWVEAAVRLLAGAPRIPGVPVLIAGVMTAVVLGVGVLVLGRGAGDEDLHMRSVLLDTAADALAAGVVAVVGVVIALRPDLSWLDPVAGALIGCVIAAASLRLLVDVLRALREGAVVELERD